MPNDHSSNSDAFQLIFAVVANPILGYLVEPFAAKKLKSGQWSYDYQRVSYITAKDYIEDFSSVHLSLLEAHRHYCDETLLKKFNRNKLKPTEFFQSLTAELISTSIRPIIEKYMARLVDVLFANNINLYFLGIKGECIKEFPLVPMQGVVEPVFCFTSTQAGIAYRLKLFYQQEPLAIQSNGSFLLAADPCLLVSNNQIYRFKKGWEGKRIIPFLQKEMVTIPKSSEKAYLQKFVVDVAKDYKVEATGFSMNVIEEKPSFHVKLEQNWQNHWTIQLKCSYHKFMFEFGDTSAAKVSLKCENDHYTITKILRDFEAEKQFTDNLESLGLINRHGDGFYLWFPASKRNGSEVPIFAGFFDYLDWISTHKDGLGISILEAYYENSTRKYFLGKPTLQMTVTDINDWFDIHAIVMFGHHAIRFHKLRKDILVGNREFPLPDGTIGIIPEEWFARFQDILKNAEIVDGSLKLRRHHFTLLNHLQEGITLVDGARIAFSEFQPPPLPNSLNATMRQYQVYGFQWMAFLYQNQMGGCLADDMGLGKTLQALTILLYAHGNSKNENSTPSTDSNNTQLAAKKNNQLALFEDLHATAPKAKHTSLLVMPLSLIHNWMHEINRFAPSLKALQYTGASRAAHEIALEQYDLVLTTYGTVRNDIDLLQNFQFHYIVLDESQVIKNAESKTFHAIKKLQSQHRLALTGTPIENTLSDLWAQFSFLNPGLLGSAAQFKEEFVIPIERNSNDTKQKKLQSLVEPFILRRTKSQVATELPELTETVRYCEMSAEQKTFYEEKKSQIRNLIFEQVEKQGFEKARFFILGNLTKLRLLANHPLMVDNEYTHNSGKFVAVSQNINDLLAEGHKVIIFSQFVKHLNIFKKHFEDCGYPYAMLTGKNNEAERAAAISKFQEDNNTKLFLISLKAGGVGLNLTAADYVFLLDPWWNPAVEKQAINRAHRIGQTKNVFVYKYISINTVEEKILKLQSKKSNLANLLEDRSNPFKNFGLDDINDLIS